jgi:two-component system phosphate regulon response regulator PhoB
MPALKVLVIEDEPDLRDILLYHLGREGFSVESTPDGYEALQIARRSRPDVVLLDLMIEGLDGFSVCRQLKGAPASGGPHIIIVSARVEEDDVLRGLAQGADDYVRKPFKPREVIARVRAVLRRTQETAVENAGEILRFHPLVINHASHEVALCGEKLALTATEYRILHYLVAHPGRVFTRAQLLRQVSGDASGVIGRNIDVHIRSLRKALGQHASLIETARGVGYRFLPPAELPVVVPAAEAKR